MRMEKMMAGVRREMKEQLIETLKWSTMEKESLKKMIEVCQRNEKEQNELGNTTERTKKEIKKMKEEQGEMRSGISEELK